MADELGRLTKAFVDRYRIERELGAGGMATVYLAEDLKHRRKVAVKVLRPELAAALGHERFLREITTTANLRHPHILPLYDSGEADGFLFYVMPYAEGETLRERLDREKQLPLDDALRIAREVADALSYAHSRGVIHRDIKPENILLESGHAVVADFGIARAVSAAGGEQLTKTGVAIGTPAYMSPEQAAGDEELDGRSDLYALGCVLYEMLAGQPPFTGPTVENLVRQHLIAQPRPITQLRPAVPVDVAGVLQRALAKNPADRFNPVAQFSDALQRPSTASAATLVPKVRRRRATTRAVAAAAVAVLAAGAWWAGHTLSSKSSRTGTIERIAVLPFDGELTSLAAGHIAEGITREVISAMTNAGVRVVGYRSVARYSGGNTPIARVARDLDVDAVASGSLLQRGDSIQVSLEVASPSTGENLWATSYYVEAAQLAGLAGNAANRVIDWLDAPRARSDRAPATASLTTPEAYTAYLLGLEAAQEFSEPGFEAAVRHFEDALEVDSTYAPAWAGIAYAMTIASFYSFQPPEVADRRAEESIDRALSLDPDNALAHQARGHLLSWTFWDQAGAEQALRRAIELEPGAGAYLDYGWFLGYVGRHDEAVAILEEGVRRDPQSALMHADLARRLWDAGQLDRAMSEVQIAMALDSAYAENHWTLAELHLLRHEYAEAEREILRYKTIAGESVPYRGVLGQIYAETGREVEARALLQELESSTGRKKYAAIARIQLALGERDPALRSLELAVRERSSFSPFHPYWAPLRPEPRFQAVLRQMGLRPDR